MPEDDFVAIETTGNLRAALAKAITDVTSGSLELDSARTIVKLAAQINESLYSEVRVRQVLADASEATSSMGRLPIG